MKNNVKAAVLALTLSATAVPAGAFPFHHTTTNQTVYVKKHKNFIQRHPIITTIGAAAVIHHFTKRR